MPVLIDSNIAIYLTEGVEEVQRKVAGLPEPPVMSLISLVELEGGVRKNPDLAAVRRARLDVLLRLVPVLPFERKMIQVYGNIVANAGFSRSRLLDRLIAATALAHDLTLVTSKGPDFEDIPNLKLEVWPRSAQ